MLQKSTFYLVSNYLNYPVNKKLMKKINIILDIDETLIKSFPCSFNFPLTCQRCHLLSDKSCWFIERPFLKDFLSLSFELFNVYVWSAGKTAYVCDVVSKIFLTKKPLMVLTRDDVVFIHGFATKPISVLSEKTNGKVNTKNTLIIDDREYSFYLNPRNGVLVPQYSIDCENFDEFIKRDHDKVLLKIMDWFQEISDYDGDVKELKRPKLFE